MQTNYWRNHLLIPMAIFTVLVVLVETMQWDLVIANTIYTWEGGQWALRDNWWLENVLHTGARNLMSLITVVMLILWVVSFTHQRWRAWRRPLTYMVISVLVSVLLVSLGKRLSQVDCPWSVDLFGGNNPYYPIFSGHMFGSSKSQCFPAGHASAGYAWLGLFFTLSIFIPKYRWIALGAVLATGMLFGGVQQFRGAHFLSHDIWTLGICWSVAVLCSPILFKGQLKHT